MSLTRLENDLPPVHALTIPRASLNHEALAFQRWPLPLSFGRPTDGRRFESRKVRTRFLVKNFLLRRPVHAGAVMWCVDNLSPANWYHWLTEVLPRLYVGRRLFSEVDHVAFPAYYRADRFVGETLDLWPDLPNVLWIPRSRRVVASPLVVVERTAPAWWYRADVMRGLSDYLIERAGHVPHGEPPQTRLYVSRADAAWRRAANEDDVRSVLEDRGFMTVYSNELTVVDQIRLFRNATCIVGLHGAGLANMVFCPPGGSVVEVAARDPHPHWQCYYSLSGAMGLRYVLCEAEPIVSSDSGFEARRDSDLLVDIGNLVAALDHLDVRP